MTINAPAKINAMPTELRGLFLPIAYSPLMAGLELTGWF
jgi:hypothetical protein